MVHLCYRGRMPIEKQGWVNVYSLVDPRTGNVRYVGQTQQKIAHRLSRHVAAANYGRQSLVSQWMREVLAEGLRPKIVLLEQVPLSDGDQAEKDWIADFKFDGYELLNETLGGHGSHGYKHSEEALAKVRAARLKQVFSEETNLKRSIALKGRPRPREVRDKIAASHRRISEEQQREIFDLYSSGEYTQSQLGEMFEIDQTRVSQIVRIQERLI